MRQQRGFTLVEVLVALVVVALGMAALMETMGSSADTATWLRERSFAQWIAFNQLTLTRLTGSLPAAGQTDGELDFAGSHWRWRQVVTSLGFPGVERIDVMVQPADTPLDEKHWMATVTGATGDAIYPPQLQSLYPDPGQTAVSASSQPAPVAAQGSQSLDDSSGLAPGDSLMDSNNGQDAGSGPDSGSSSSPGSAPAAPVTL